MSGVQQRQRRVLRRQPGAAHRHPARRVGLRGLRDQRLDLRASATPRTSVDGRPRRRDAVSDGAGRRACATRSSREDVTWEQIDRSIERVVVDLAALRRRAAAADARLTTSLACARAPGAGARGRREVGRAAPQRAGRRRARAAARPRPSCERVAVLGRLAVDREPRRRRVERRLGTRRRDRARRASRPRCPTSTSCTTTAPTSTAAADVARQADVALVVVGYTYVDEGEYIGDAGVDLAQPLPAGATTRQLVERFDAETETRRPIEHAEHVGERGAGGFARGGDRTSLRLHDDARRADPRRRRREPAHRRRDRRGQRGRDLGVGRRGARDRAVLVRGDGRRPRARRRAARRGRRVGAAAVLRARDGGAPSRRSIVTPTASSTTAGTAGGSSLGTATQPAYPFGFGLELHDLRAGRSERRGGRRRDRASDATLRNTGSRRGTDVVQVYSADPPRLVGFARREIDPGETDRARDRRSRSSGSPCGTSTRHAMVVRPGRYELRVARSAADAGIRLQVDVT